MTGLASQRVREVPVKTDPAIPGAPRARARIDVIRLKRALRKAVDGEVRFDPGSLAMYANDASNFRQVPIGVVIPRTLDDVVAAHRVCHQFGAPILNRGGGTSLSGETVNYAVVINHSKYLTGIGEIDPEQRLVTCQTGVINEELNRHTGQHNLVFGPDPSSHSRCVIGGNIGNNSCGVHSVQAQLYGPGPRTSDNVHALEVVTYDGARFWVGNDEEAMLEEIIAAGGRQGEIYAALRDLRDKYADEIRARYPSVAKVPRRVSGYNLDELLPEKGFNVARALTGTESTCVTVLRAVLMLTPAMLKRTLVVVGFAALAEATEHCQEIIERWRPIGLEGLDEELIQDQSAQRMHVRESRRAAQGRVTGLAAGTVRRRHRRGVGGHRAGLRDVADRREGIRRGPDPGDEKRAGGRAEPGHLEDPRGRPRLHRVRAGGRTTGRAGRTRRCRPSTVGRYLRDLRKLIELYGSAPPCTAISARAAFTAGVGFDLHERTASTTTAPSWRRRPTWWCATAARCPASTATARQRAELLAEDVRRRAGPGLPGVQADLGPGLEDEPGQGRRPLPAGREPAAGHRLQPAAA